METMNATITESRHHAGQKVPIGKRKGRNKRICTSDYTVINPAQDGGLAKPDAEDTQAQPAMFPMAGTA